MHKKATLLQVIYLVTGVFLGLQIQRLTEAEEGTVNEKTAMVRAARQLLSAITKVLILADKVVVKQLIVAKDKVCVQHSARPYFFTFVLFGAD